MLTQLHGDASSILDGLETDVGRLTEAIQVSCLVLTPPARATNRPSIPGAAAHLTDVACPSHCRPWNRTRCASRRG